MFNVRRTNAIVDCCCGSLTLDEWDMDWDRFRNDSVKRMYTECSIVALSTSHVVLNLMAVHDQDNEQYEWTYEFVGEG